MVITMRSLFTLAWGLLFSFSGSVVFWTVLTFFAVASIGETGVIAPAIIVGEGRIVSLPQPEPVAIPSLSPDKLRLCTDPNFPGRKIPCNDAAGIKVSSCTTTTDVIKAFGLCRPRVTEQADSRDLFQQTLSPAGEITRLSLEAKAEQGVIKLHDLPSSDLARVQRNARGSTRAALQALIVGIMQKSPSLRSDGEKNLVENYESLTKDFRVLSTRYAKAEYDIWAANPCGYRAPSEPEYKPDPAFCGAGGEALLQCFLR